MYKIKRDIKDDLLIIEHDHKYKIIHLNDRRPCRGELKKLTRKENKLVKIYLSSYAALNGYSTKFYMY